MKAWMGPAIGAALLLFVMTRPSVWQQWDFSYTARDSTRNTDVVTSDSITSWSQGVMGFQSVAPRVVRDPFITQNESQDVLPEIPTDANTPAAVEFPIAWKLVGRVNTQTALLQQSPDLVSMISVGSVISGWTVQQISPRGVSFCLGKNCHTLLPP